MIQYLLNEDKFIPKAILKRVQDIDLEGLKKEGYKGLIFDIDNTLIPYDDRSLKPWHKELVKQLKALGLKTMLLTNNHHKDVHEFAKSIGLQVITSANKPLKKGFLRALEILQLDAQEVVMVGDQFMTDLYGASRVNIATILVRPIKQKSEKWYTKILRNLETKMKAKVGKKYPELIAPLNDIHHA